MAIQPIALPGGYGARDDFQGKEFINPLESLQMLQGQQSMGQNQRKMDLLNADEMRKQRARETLSSRLSQPVQVSDLEKSQIKSEVQAFKAKNPQIQVSEEQIYNDFMKRRMQQKQNLQQDKLMKSQVDVGGYLASEQSGSEDSLQKAQVTRLEQIWKDAERSKRQIAQIYGVNSGEYKYYDDLQKRVIGQLKDHDPVTWGGLKDGVPTPTPTPDTVNDVDKKGSLTDVKDFISTSAVDSDNDGFIDGVASLKDNVRFRLGEMGYGNTDRDYKAIMNYIEDLEKEFRDRKQGKTEQAKLGREAYRNYIDTELPNIDKAQNDLDTMRRGFVTAIAQAERAPAGGAYIAMKKALGDALSNADFAGIAGMGLSEGLIGKMKELFGATVLTEDQAKEIVNSSIDGYNSMVSDYMNKFDDSNEFGKKAKKAYKINSLEKPDFSGSKGPAKSSESSENVIDESNDPLGLGI